MRGSAVGQRTLLLISVFATSLMIGDGVLTPAVSGEPRSLLLILTPPVFLHAAHGTHVTERGPPPAAAKQGRRKRPPRPQRACCAALRRAQ